MSSTITVTVLQLEKLRRSKGVSLETISESTNISTKELKEKIFMMMWDYCKARES